MRDREDPCDLEAVEGEDVMKTVCLAALVLTLSSGLLLADKATDERLANAAMAFDEIMAAPDKGIPGSVLNKAECVVIVPGMKKGGFIVGGSFGRGAVTCRGKNKSGWGPPAMVELGGGSVGFQIGAEATDVVMLIMDRTGMDSLLKSKFTLGGDASVAAGPVGRESTAETDAAMKAKILSYSRSRGAFAGVSLQGTTLHQDEDANKAVYGKELNASDILGGGVATPASAMPLNKVLMKHSPKGI
jgi:SH3 domain-containing YSC84-like protein 1